MKLKTLLKDPLAQFLLIGAAIWFIHSLTAEPSAASMAARIIHVPSHLEGDARQQYIHRELLLREARQLGLNHNDSIIERQLQQKMRLLLESTAPVEVTDEALQNWIKANPDRYLEPAKVTLQYRLFRRSEYGANTQREANAYFAVAKQEPVKKVQAETLQQRSHAQLRRQFGQVAADAVFAAAGNDWQQPISSGLGWLVFRNQQRWEATPAAFEKIKKRARVDWLVEQENAAYQQGLERLQQRYVIAD